MQNSFVLCWPKEMLEKPKEGSIIKNCSQCKREVWVMPKNLILGNLICLICGEQQMGEAQAKGEPVYVDKAENARTHLN